MKNISLIRNSILKTTLLLLICTGPFLSCKKFLEESIDNRSPITNIDDLEKTVITLLPYADHIFTDMMTDDYSFKDIAGHVVGDTRDRIRPIFTFQITKQSIDKGELIASGFNPNTAYLRYYFRINNANLLIERANALKNSGISDTRVNNVIAHALAIKAYCNFMLTNLFGKQYDKATASTDLAVPYIGEYNSAAVVNRPRSSVEFMYNKVESDWLSALNLIDEKNTVTKTNFYFSKRSIYGLLSKLYLNKKDWANSIKYADSALLISKIGLNIKTLRQTFKDDPDGYSKGYFNPANASYLLMGNNTYQLIAYFWSGFYPYPLMEFYKKNGGGNFGDFSTDEMIQTSGLFSDKIPQKYVYFYSAANRSMNLPLVTIDEIIFNKAEATIQNENAINNAVKTDLRTMIDNMDFTAVATTRLKNEVNNLSTKEAGITTLLNLKRYRFYSEGIRWFDIKRNNLSVSHNYNGTDFIIDGKNPNDYVIKVPLEEVTFNPDVN
jgi:hypothetical protein